jgi:hypothetical protein
MLGYPLPKTLCDHVLAGFWIEVMGALADCIADAHRRTARDYEPRWKLLRTTLTLIWRFVPITFVVLGAAIPGVMSLIYWAQKYPAQAVGLVTTTVVVLVPGLCSLADRVASSRLSSAEISPS